MLIDRRLIEVPSKKIIVDLVSRTGSATDDSYSPYDGQLKELSRQFPGGEIPPNAISIIAMQDDYDADKQRPQAGVYMKEVLRDSAHLRKLEEIDESWVIQYLKNAITGAKINRRKSFREESRRVREVNALKDNDGDFVEASTLLLEEHDYSPLDVVKWQEKLPYLLKRLHDKSKEGGVSILSLLISYERARRKNRHRGRDVKPGEILAESVYFMTKSGHIGSRATENKHKMHDIWMKWIRGFEDFKDSYFHDAMELLDICERLGIDIAKEDPFDYQEEYIDSLTVTYIAKNRDVLMRGCRAVNRELLEELGSATLSDYMKAKVKPEAFNEHKLLNWRMQKFLSSTDTRILKDISREREIINFCALLSRVTGEKISVARSITRDGFYMRDRNNPRKFNVTPIYSGGDRVKAECLIHSSGYLILVSDTIPLYYLDIVTATDYLIDVFNGNVNPRTRYNNKSFGKWDDTVL